MPFLSGFCFQTLLILGIILSHCYCTHLVVFQLSNICGMATCVRMVNCAAFLIVELISQCGR